MYYKKENRGLLILILFSLLVMPVTSLYMYLSRSQSVKNNIIFHKNKMKYVYVKTKYSQTTFCLMGVGGNT